MEQKIDFSKFRIEVAPEFWPNAYKFTDGRQIIAMATVNLWKYTDGYVHITDFSSFIPHEHVGTTFLKGILHLFNNKGKGFILDCRKDNIIALKLYKNLGFCIHSDKTSYVTMICPNF